MLLSLVKILNSRHKRWSSMINQKLPEILNLSWSNNKENSTPQELQSSEISSTPRNTLSWSSSQPPSLPWLTPTTKLQLELFSECSTDFLSRWTISTLLTCPSTWSTHRPRSSDLSTMPILNREPNQPPSQRPGSTLSSTTGPSNSVKLLSQPTRRRNLPIKSRESNLREINWSMKTKLPNSASKIWLSTKLMPLSLRWRRSKDL